MHSRLEAYVAETEVRLRSLPEDQRVSDIAELRQHLESMVEAYKELNYTEDEAVRHAVERFGKSKVVSGKLIVAYRKANRRQIANPFSLGAWSLFLVSMLLPVMNVFGVTLHGFQCALCVLDPSIPASAQPWGALYYHGIGAANILMLVSPILLALLSTKRQLWILTAVLGLAMVSIAPLASGTTWGIGFYVWWASFGLVTASCFMRALRVGNRSNCISMV